MPRWTTPGSVWRSSSPLPGRSVRRQLCRSDRVFENSAGRFEPRRPVAGPCRRERVPDSCPWQVLNATGPWVDKLCQWPAIPAAFTCGRPSGFTSLPCWGLAAAFLLLHPLDGRVFFVIPWLGKTLIGTTDTLCDESPDSLGVSAAEVDYLLAGHNHFFNPPLTTTDLLGQFVEVRPLIRASAREPSALTREFRLFETASGLLTVAGGKFTTYRRMAEFITDWLLGVRLKSRRRGRTRDHQRTGLPQNPGRRSSQAPSLRSVHVTPSRRGPPAISCIATADVRSTWRPI